MIQREIIGFSLLNTMRTHSPKYLLIKNIEETSHVHNRKHKTIFRLFLVTNASFHVSESSNGFASHFCNLV